MTAPLDLTLSTHKWRNTTFSGPSGDVWYSIESEGGTWTLSSKPVYIHRVSPKDGSQDVLATITFHCGTKNSMIEYEGETMELKKMFPKTHWYGVSRQMTSPIGKCKWTNNLGRPTLTSPNGDPLIKYSNNYKVFSKSESAVLSVAPEAIPFLDLVVIGWVVEMYDIEQQIIATNAAAAS